MKQFLLRQRIDVGLLVARVGVGLLFASHGYPKITGGPETWERLGGAMANLGLGFAPTFWGLMAAIAEFGGGICLALGLFTRVAATMAAFTMLVAAIHHVVDGDPARKIMYPLELMSVFVALFLTGPGKLSLDRKLFGGDVESSDAASG